MDGSALRRSFAAAPYFGSIPGGQSAIVRILDKKPAHARSMTMGLKSKAPGSLLFVVLAFAALNRRHFRLYF